MINIGHPETDQQLVEAFKKGTENVTDEILDYLLRTNSKLTKPSLILVGELFFKKYPEARDRIHMISILGNPLLDIGRRIDSFLLDGQLRGLAAYPSIEVPFTDPIDLDTELKIANEIRQLIDSVTIKEDELFQKKYAGRIIGASKGILDVKKLVARVAPSDSTVLIFGETGTGKELVAREIHELSSRKEKPFVAINCGAIVPTLIESELFGHEKGSFTGATSQKKGLFEVADGGTIFLDEIAELLPETQIKLLRVLQEKEFNRVGGDKPIKVNVRVVAATNKDLLREISEGKFREDLYYRINVLQVKLPLLRERTDDIPVLFDYFLKQWNNKNSKSVKREKQADKRLKEYAWPGNVRELEHYVERAAVLCDDGIITSLQLQGLLESYRSDKIIPGLSLNIPEGSTLKDVEKIFFLAVFNKNNGSTKATAVELDVDPKTVYTKKIEYGLK